MPKVFLSWSGKDSHKVAQALYTWLPVMLQSVKPFMSSEDLRKGGRWNSELAIELEQASFGIICLTRSNLEAPWVLFEAGALSKVVDEARVAPLLIGIQHSDLPKPLTQFNATTGAKDDIRKLLKDINKSNQDDTVDEDLLTRSFDACWPKLEEALKQAAVSTEPVDSVAKKEGDPVDTVNSILQELLALARSQSQLLSSPQTLFPAEFIATLNEKIHGSVPPQHKVWRDLRDRLLELKAAIQMIEEPSERDALMNIYRSLYRPIDYISSRVGVRLMIGEWADPIQTFDKEKMQQILRDLTKTTKKSQDDKEPDTK